MLSLSAQHFLGTTPRRNVAHINRETDSAASFGLVRGIPYLDVLSLKVFIVDVIFVSNQFTLEHTIYMSLNLGKSPLADELNNVFTEECITVFTGFGFVFLITYLIGEICIDV